MDEPDLPSAEMIFRFIALLTEPRYGVYLDNECVCSDFGSRCAAWGWVGTHGLRGAPYKVKRQ